MITRRMGIAPSGVWKRQGLFLFLLLGLLFLFFFLSQGVCRVSER